MLRRTLLVALAGLALAGCQKAGAALAPADPAAGKAFLEKTAKEDGVQRLPSGSLYKVLKAGPAEGRSPGPQDEVKVHYELSTITGEKLESSFDTGSPAVFGVSQVVPGWTEALQKMKPGDVWMLYLPPEQGYGDMQAGPIPPGSVLVFKIELIDMLPGGGPVLG